MTYKLRTCIWELTLACCFSCKYCGSNAGRARDNELTTEECLLVAKQLANIGCERVVLIGGEVFIKADWVEIAKALTSKGIRTSVITNGYSISDSIISGLKESGIDSVGVSLDSIREIHDFFRQKGSFDRAVEAINTLADKGIPTAIISAVNSRSAGYLEEFYSCIKQFPIYAWQIQACSPMGNAKTNELDCFFDFQKVISFVYEKQKEAPFMIGVGDNIGYYSEEEGYIRGNSSGLAVFSGCKAGISAVGIDSAGNVRGCESLYDDSFIEGNLRETSLKEIWESPESFSYNRKLSTDLLTGHCKTCSFAIYCKGGCRSYNYFANNNLYNSPFCVWNLHVV